MTPLPSSSDKYRRQEPEKPWQVRRAMRDIDRANAIPIKDVLYDDFGITIPGDIVRSWKAKCPFGWEHYDGGVEKVLRVYPSNSAFCFALHGVLTPVRITEIRMDLKPLRAARVLLSRYGIVTDEPYWKKMERLVLESATKGQGTGSPIHASQALQAALTRLPGYGVRQFDQDVIEVVERNLEALDDALAERREGAVREWLVRATENVREVVDRGEGE